MESYILKGNIVFSKSPGELAIYENGYLVCEGGISKGVFTELPDRWKNCEVKDYGNQLIIPGLSDMHLHAPQYTFRGLGMNLELLDWLNTYTFPEESKYKNLEYAKMSYQLFVNDLKKSGTTRVCVFATIHEEATNLLMELLEESGIRGYVGKVSMNRNCPETLLEKDAIQSIHSWLDQVKGKFKNIQPILTPRFIPSCSDDIIRELATIQKENNIPLQSHLSENKAEIAWVQELCPESSCYGDAYDRLHAFGSNGKTVMAHCVYSNKEESKLMKQRGVFIAHCPQSNTNLASGIAPVKRYLMEDQKIGLGSDIAGGGSLSILRAMADAIQVSKLRWRLVDEAEQPLTIEEGFYLGTKGGGSFFGKVGSFEEGYELDALVIDDSKIRHPKELSVKSRLESIIYLSDQIDITHTFVAGNEI